MNTDELTASIAQGDVEAIQHLLRDVREVVQMTFRLIEISDSHLERVTASLNAEVSRKNEGTWEVGPPSARPYNARIGRCPSMIKNGSRQCNNTLAEGLDVCHVHNPNSLLNTVRRTTAMVRSMEE